MKTSNCLSHLLLISLFFLCYACGENSEPHPYEVIEGMYEGVQITTYRYTEGDMSGQPHIQRKNILWEVKRANSDSLQIDNHIFHVSKTDNSDWAFSYLDTDETPYGSYLVESSEVWFFPEQDSLYMETLIPDPSPAELELESVITTAKFIE